MCDFMMSPYLEEMDKIVQDKFSSGDAVGGLRLFVPDNGDINEESIAEDFCHMEKAREEKKVKISENTFSL